MTFTVTREDQRRAEAKPSQPLKACPFDGGRRLVVVRTARYDGEYVDEIETPDFYAYNVHCTSCAADGPWRKSQGGAEQFWNGLPGTKRGDTPAGAR